MINKYKYENEYKLIIGGLTFGVVTGLIITGLYYLIGGLI